MELKVLLVEPPKSIWELMGDCVSPPLGLLQLAAVLEEQNIEVEVLDCNALELGWAELEGAIERAQPNIVGATAITPFFPAALRVMKIARRVDPGITTILGGPHVTFLPEESLFDNPEVDLIVRGEGERTIVDLTHCLRKGGTVSGVQGIAFRHQDQVILTPPQPLVDVNKLPLPAYHLVPMGKYCFTVFDKFTTILSSRGCPHRCTFCSEWRFWGECWRPREPETVVDEMELLHKKYGRECFWFGDDCFNVDREHIEGICHEIVRRGLDVSWYYQGRADLLIKHKDLLPLMRRAGNLMAQIGVESSTDRELAEFNKHLTTDQVKEAVGLLKRHDIVSQGLLVVGTRHDSVRSINHKLRYMQWLDADFPIFTMFTPFPGSGVYHEAKEKGWLETMDYSCYNMASAIMPTEHLSRRQLTSWYQWCFSSYYSDPVKLAKGLLSRNAWKRKIWRHMVKYILKQFVRSFV